MSKADLNREIKELLRHPNIKAILEKLENPKIRNSIDLLLEIEKTENRLVDWEKFKQFIDRNFSEEKRDDILKMVDYMSKSLSYKLKYEAVLPKLSGDCGLILEGLKSSKRALTGPS